jgi:hypothetical protein
MAGDHLEKMRSRARKILLGLSKDEVDALLWMSKRRTPKRPPKAAFSALKRQGLCHPPPPLLAFALDLETLSPLGHTVVKAYSRSKEGA